MHRASAEERDDALSLSQRENMHMIAQANGTFFLQFQTYSDACF